MADAAVVTHTCDHVLDVVSDCLGDGSDGVDETELRGEEGVRHVLDQLRGSRIGHDPGCSQAQVQRGDLERDLPVVRSDHYPIRIQEVVNRSPLSQELRVGHHMHVIAAQRLGNHHRRAHGYRRLVDHDRTSREERARCRRTQS